MLGLLYVLSLSPSLPPETDTHTRYTLFTLTHTHTPAFFSGCWSVSKVALARELFTRSVTKGRETRLRDKVGGDLSTGAFRGQGLSRTGRVEL